MFNLDNIIRRNIKVLAGYSSARDEFEGMAEVYLDANESPFESKVNRYPDPNQKLLKSRISQIKGVSEENIILGNGSDEIIDLLIRAFCNPGKDAILTLTPSYGMYRVTSEINDVTLQECMLDELFGLDVLKLLSHVQQHTKLIFLCSPNNPTGSIIPLQDIMSLCREFKGIVVVDEAYIDFAESGSCVTLLSTLPNLFVMQTFSKSWAGAGLRIGMGFGSKPIIDVLKKIKPPYNISSVNQNRALSLLTDTAVLNQRIDYIKIEREKLYQSLRSFPQVLQVFPSQANFLLFKVNKARKLYEYLAQRGVVIRDRSTQPLCEGCLRVTIGTYTQNQQFINLLNQYYDA